MDCNLTENVTPILELENLVLSRYFSRIVKASLFWGIFNLFCPKKERLRVRNIRILITNSLVVFFFSSFFLFLSINPRGFPLNTGLTAVAIQS